MTEHTPGPWTIDLSDNMQALHIKQGSMVVAIIHTEKRFTKEISNLIARAPELLAENEALKERIEELESEAEVISAEFEGDLWKGVRRILLNECGLDYDDFPLSADAAIESIKNEMDQRASDRDKLKARIAELEAERNWQPNETAPKDGTLVLVRDEPWVTIPKKTRVANYRIASWVFGRGFGSKKGRKVTGWMPLPKMEDECPTTQHGDKISCECGNVWDISHPYPPNCKFTSPQTKTILT